MEDGEWIQTFGMCLSWLHEPFSGRDNTCFGCSWSSHSRCVTPFVRLSVKMSAIFGCTTCISNYKAWKSACNPYLHEENTFFMSVLIKIPSINEGKNAVNSHVKHYETAKAIKVSVSVDGKLLLVFQVRGIWSTGIRYRNVFREVQAPRGKAKNGVRLLGILCGDIFTSSSREPRW